MANVGLLSLRMGLLSIFCVIFAANFAVEIKNIILFLLLPFFLFVLENGNLLLLIVILSISSILILFLLISYPLLSLLLTSPLFLPTITPPILLLYNSILPYTLPSTSTSTSTSTSFNVYPSFVSATNHRDTKMWIAYILTFSSLFSSFLSPFFRPPSLLFFILQNFQ